MPTTQDVKKLISGITFGNWDEIYDAGETIASKLIKQGHRADGDWIRETLTRKDVPKYLQKANDNMNYHVTTGGASLDDLIVPPMVKEQLRQIFKEYQKRKLLKDNGLSNANKILLVGNPGTGKTMTAGIIAHELGLPLRTLRQENVINSLMGSTAKKLSALLPIYDEAGAFPAVYFLDEFDTFASKRLLAQTASDREYNEITNVLLKEMDHINSDCLLVCATNLAAGFDPAVFRRFDAIIHFPDANVDTTKQLIISLQDKLMPNYIPSGNVLKKLSQFPPSIIKKIIENAKKTSLLDEVEIDDELFLKLIAERNSK
ncbi:AAA family ATPase [Lactobacillus crispatus]|uniref:AAA family ATPase n=1 Tax=Lactobacillus crispatus TaxID=47770 RepID=UPI000761C396|nr:ATP-binding protein [Lactobacillus crispatus]KWU07891.1 hypothetical protein AEL98_10680 [Lactobacillus crispatus]